MRSAKVLILFAACLGGAPTLAGAADWLQFRGPGGLGITEDKDLPLTWSADKNVAWKTEMPGPGSSSPIVVGNKIFLTCYTGYGLDRKDAGDMKNLKRHLLCVDRKGGKVLWTRTIEAALPEAAYSGSFITLHGYASSTPVSDGKTVYVFFGRSGVYAFDLEGQELWHTSVGTQTHEWGSGTSPVLYKDLLIVNASVESEALVALDKKSGTEVWRAKGISESWNTPALVNLPGGKTELVVGAARMMLGYDPDSGKGLWYAKSFNWYVCPSVVVHDGVVYGLKDGICVAVKAGGRDDVTKSHTLWQKNLGSVVSSAVYHDGHLYWANQHGMAYCVRTADGSVAYKERLKPNSGLLYASPLLGDGKIYYVSRQAGTFVVAASPTFKLLAHNTLDPDTSVFNDSPAVSNSQLLLRSDRYLYCIGAGP